MRDIVPGERFKAVVAPISTDRGDIRWLKVSKTAFNTAIVGIRAMGTALANEPSLPI